MSNSFQNWFYGDLQDLAREFTVSPQPLVSRGLGRGCWGCDFRRKKPSGEEACGFAGRGCTCYNRDGDISHMAILLREQK